MNFIFEYFSGEYHHKQNLAKAKQIRENVPIDLASVDEKQIHWLEREHCNKTLRQVLRHHEDPDTKRGWHHIIALPDCGYNCAAQIFKHMNERYYGERGDLEPPTRIDTNGFMGTPSGQFYLQTCTGNELDRTIWTPERD